MNCRSNRRRLPAAREFEKTNDKLLKLIKFEFEVQRSTASHIVEVHKQRLKELLVCLT